MVILSLITRHPILFFPTGPQPPEHCGQWCPLNGPLLNIFPSSHHSVSDSMHYLASFFSPLRAVQNYMLPPSLFGRALSQHQWLVDGEVELSLPATTAGRGDPGFSHPPVSD